VGAGVDGACAAWTFFVTVLPALAVGAATDLRYFTAADIALGAAVLSRAGTDSPAHVYERRPGGPSLTARSAMSTAEEREAWDAGMHIIPPDHELLYPEGDNGTVHICLWVRDDVVVIKAACLNVEDVFDGPHLEDGARSVAREEGWRPRLSLDPRAYSELHWNDLYGNPIDYLPEWVCFPANNRKLTSRAVVRLAREIAVAWGLPVEVIDFGDVRTGQVSQVVYP
jgi:hypothetical protein